MDNLPKENETSPSNFLGTDGILGATANSEETELFLEDDLYGILGDGDSDTFDFDLLSGSNSSRHDSLDNDSSQSTRKQSLLSTENDDKLNELSEVSSRPWHNELENRKHREFMIHEIARLLEGRKKFTPSDDWIKQLPHKAKKLECGLYRTAPTLDAYLDQTTLKARMKVLARKITRQYKDTKRLSSVLPSFNSRNSGSTQGRSSHRSSSASYASRDSLSSIREAVATKASIGQNGNDQANDMEDDEKSTLPLHTIDSIPSMHKDTQVVRQRSLSMNDKTATEKADRLPKDAFSQQVPPTKLTPLANVTTGPSVQKKATNEISQSVSRLEQQKAANERLQQQIRDSMRQRDAEARLLQGNGDSEQQLDLEPNPFPAMTEGPGRSFLNSGQNGIGGLNPASVATNSNNATVNQRRHSLNFPPSSSQFNAGANSAVSQLAPNLLMAQAALLNNRMNNSFIGNSSTSLLGMQLPIPAQLGSTSMLSNASGLPYDLLQQVSSQQTSMPSQLQAGMLRASSAGVPSTATTTNQLFQLNRSNNVGFVSNNGAPDTNAAPNDTSQSGELSLSPRPFYWGT